jgi:peptidoglycan-N-acetylglucosamine deacetylase
VDPETEIIPVYVKKQVFHSLTARRGPYLLVLAAFLVAAAVLGWQWALVRTAQPLPGSARYNTSASYPRSVATALARCGQENGEFGPNGTLQVPVIGQGIFQRIVRIVPDGSTTYAVDPFTGKVVQSLTSLEQHATRDCRYAVQEYGAIPRNTVVLAYSSGPNAEWTPRILGVLQAYGVHATFFDVGVNILANQPVFRAEISSGNAVGNQTLDNPDLAHQTGIQGRQEFVTNARIMAVTGHYQSRLFATPYAGTAQQTVEQNLFATLEGQQLGSAEVNLAGGAWDYQISSNEIPKLQRDGSGVALAMYDGGGNEAAPLHASINLIREAKSLGYQFMTIPQLLKAQGFQGAVTGPAQPSLADRVGYWLYQGPHITRAQLLRDAMKYMTIFVGVITVLWALAAAWGRFWDYRKPPAWQPEKVSILVPAWNESKVLRRTVESIVRHPHEFGLEIVLVDDGS